MFHYDSCYQKKTWCCLSIQTSVIIVDTEESIRYVWIFLITQRPVTHQILGHEKINLINQIKF